MLLAVLDANVYVSAHLSPGGPPGRCLAAAVDGAYEIVASPAILDETRRALGYPKVRRLLRASDADLDAWVASIGLIARLVEGTARVRAVAADPADDIYVAAALEAGAGHIVSGDRHLLDIGTHEGVRMISPRDFLHVIEAGR